MGGLGAKPWQGNFVEHPCGVDVKKPFSNGQTAASLAKTTLGGEKKFWEVVEEGKHWAQIRTKRSTPSAPPTHISTAIFLHTKAFSLVEKIVGDVIPEEIPSLIHDGADPNKQCIMKLGSKSVQLNPL
uniref:Uncharacterized protein n=1 Tax=Chromera velia CCMP2878 TaxID=1169474 RepID=A0A0G4IA83_9ALVE|eukprot:Cvel_12470.t1-p1 / transcript=Cvel_12470.t1 / gene=Cvel_12470 / organism=Chromera_velia_CCMP2878 / gene_product=hypothetical protein / transcript_product=hypothetical protein / location=Cvel_scaffold817:52161-53801(-) / protein_length=127 / sequence_SO=supercontig / SO=protein_coding / is_pseudo=false